MAPPYKQEANNNIHRQKAAHAEADQGATPSHSRCAFFTWSELQP